MYFDANPKIMEELQARLRQDPTVLRSTTLKVGSQLMKCIESPSRTETPTFKQLPDDGLFGLNSQLYR
jgi:small subunit ribosomal protein S6